MNAGKAALSGRRAPYASDPAASRGRLFAEPESPERTVFQRDRDRILHATAFRRLKDKTQVFLHDEGDHYRTRLTHTLEVSQIARSIARSLALDEDLAETVALAHDIGHPPFGHAGERALDAEMAAYGGFDHNAQALRVVTELEARYPDFDGLNLTWETLEGLAKHNGPLLDAAGAPAGPYARAMLPAPFARFNDVRDLELASFAGPEAQIAALADDIAYNAHDVDDGLRSGLLGLEDLEAVDLTRGILEATRTRYPHLTDTRTIAELIRRLISAMIGDVTAEARARLDRLKPETVADIRAGPSPVVAFGPAMAASERALKAMLTDKLYRHRQVAAVMDAAESAVRQIFRHLMDGPATLPGSVQGESEAQRARRVADRIAGMTDRFAIAEYTRLFGRPPPIR